MWCQTWHRCNYHIMKYISYKNARNIVFLLCFIYVTPSKYGLGTKSRQVTSNSQDGHPIRIPIWDWLQDCIFPNVVQLVQSMSFETTELALTWWPECAHFRTGTKYGYSRCGTMHDIVINLNMMHITILTLSKYDIIYTQIQIITVWTLQILTFCNLYNMICVMTHSWQSMSIP